jgi:Na+/melibiose symporter-like transporter
VECSLFASPRFYLYAIILILGTLYMDIVTSIFPYFFKSLTHGSEFNYLSTVTTLYFTSFIYSTLTRDSFLFMGTRTTMTFGFLICASSTLVMVIGFTEHELGPLIVAGLCLVGIARVIASNCAFNIINELVSSLSKGK